MFYYSFKVEIIFIPQSYLPLPTAPLAILAFQDHGSGMEALIVVPLVLGEGMDWMIRKKPSIVED